MWRSGAGMFVRHYVEMLVAMVLGMVVLGGAAAGVLGLLGEDVGAWDTERPTLLLLGMGLTMTLPMLAWMAHRGHSRAALGDMALAMAVPTLAVVALLETGALVDLDALMAIEHVAMLGTMLAAMLWRRAEYTHADHGAVAA